MAIEPIPLHRDDVDPRPPGSVRGDIDRLLAGLGAPSTPVLQRIHEAWAELVGPAAAEHCRPGRLVEGRLHLEVDDPAWASQLRWSRADVLARIAASIPGAGVTALVVRVGRPRESDPGVR